MRNALFTTYDVNPLKNLMVDGAEYKYIHNTVIIGQAPIALRNAGNRYSVQYGRKIKVDLTYAEAAQEYGECILHALMSAGRIQ